jgi:methyl-accepting chemotaxis protein
MKNLKVSLKLIVSFMIVVVLAVTVGAMGIYGMYKINGANNSLYDENVVALSAMGNIREILQDQIVQIQNLALNAGNNARLQEIQRTIATLEQDILAYFETYEGAITDTQAEYAYFDGKNVYLTDFAMIKRRVAEASLISTDAANEILFDQNTADVKRVLVSDFSLSMQYNDQFARDAANANTALYKAMTRFQIIALVATVSVALFLAFYISNMISRLIVPMSVFFNKAGLTGDLTLAKVDQEVIGEYIGNKDELGQLTVGAVAFIERLSNVSSVLETVSNGDLTAILEPLSDKDVLGMSLHRMISNLNDMFAEIQSSTMQVSSGSKQVADGSQALAQGSTEQAASIQELSSSITEIAVKTKENAEIAEKTTKLSETIKDNAEKGSRQMDDMIQAVKEINEASQSISKIIKTIDDIAFQTNILALNAAVEAARAGQHGKGFAVVAEEVRNLASKSADAAKDTGDMIQNSMEKAELGSNIAEETAQSLSEIVTGINESGQLIEEIARASEEQSMGISQINIGIDQVAQVVQQNSATAEQSAAASQEMSGQSDLLQQLISQFKLKDDATALHRLPASRY